MPAPTHLVTTVVAVLDDKGAVVSWDKVQVQAGDGYPREVTMVLDGKRLRLTTNMQLLETR